MVESSWLSNELLSSEEQVLRSKINSEPPGSKTSSSHNLKSKSRRFAVTRGFDNSGLSRLAKPSPNNTLAANSSSQPSDTSTPLSTPRAVSGDVLKQKLYGIGSAIGTLHSRTTQVIKTGLQLPPKKTISPGLDSRNKNEIVRKSVITPLNTPNCSLDLDSYLTPDFTRHSTGERLAQQVDEQEISIRGNILPNLRVTLIPSGGPPLSFVQKEAMSRFPQPPDEMDSGLRAQLQAEMNIECKKLMNKFQLVQDMMDDYTVQDVNLGNYDRVESRLNEISDARSSFRAAVRSYKELYGQYGDSDGQLDSYISSINNSVRTHANQIWARVAEINPPMTQFERESLQIQRQQLEQQRAQVLPSSNSHQSGHISHHRQSAPRDVNQQGVRNCEGKRLMFRDELRYLTDSLMLPDYGEINEFWREQSESDVRKAMRKISEWDKSLIRLSRTFRDYETLSKQYVDNDEELQNDTEDFMDIRNKVKEVTTAVQDEDERRNLQTLEYSKSDKVDYPSFSGEPGEDLVRFREKINDCFKKNRVPESDQIDKLRENLKGLALKRVPITVKKVAVAWSNLNEAFGSPLLVLRERLKSLNKIGGIPSDTVPNKQITWYHDMEAVLQDILDLGDSSDLNMQMGAFGPPVQEQILKAFSENPIKKQELAIAGGGKQPREKFVAYREKIIEYRKRTQLAEVESGSSADKRSIKSTAPGSTTAHISYPSPKRNDNCRICLHFQEQPSGSNLVLFEKHLGSLPIQCPNFISLKMSERRKIAIKAKLCIYCLHSEVEFSPDHGKLCREGKRKTKSSFTCAASNCSCHYWLCTNHSEDNRKKLKDAARGLEKHGLKLVFHGTMSLTSRFSPEMRNASQAIENQIDKELLPVPSGQPLFMFFGAKGKTRSILCFFDSGCSRFVMRENIPGKELPASLVRAGPIPIGGVGGMTVEATGEYLVAMETVDCKAQLLQGVTVPVITGDFPILDISSAASAVKADNKKNTKLRNCKLPSQIGGSVDCLIGIQYSQLLPKVVHMLPSGLAIYETKLAPHLKGFNYVLGGPHSSFDNMLATSGNATFLLNEFVSGLDRWRNSGPPSLTQYIMSKADISDAIDNNLITGDVREYKELVQHEAKEVESCLDELVVSSCDSTIDTESIVPVQTFSSCAAAELCNFSQVAICTDCGKHVLNDQALYEEEKLSRLKHILDKQECGLDVSYRCVRCRDCIDCKNSVKVDKISLREEAELFEIKKSVFLDWAGRKIVCSLPLRGKERDFLTSNEDRALRVLDAQCKKYYSDDETKATIVASFQKLIDKKYIVFLEDLPAETLKKFLNKEVQYYLPWRIQFKPGSASTPARVVFDGSSGTRKRADGSGGRCLNDAVCKGPIDTLDLLKVILRFLIGRYALAADLTKMYNQFLLKPDQWNLQRVLFRENLNPNAPIKQACVTTLIYGVKSVSGQTEHAFKEIADQIKDEQPDVAMLLTDGRYCDNLLNSTATLSDAENLAEATSEVLDRLNLPTKGFSFSGKDPQPQESLDGVSIDVGGMRWCTAVDSIEVKVPCLHFGKRLRGRVIGVEFFTENGDFAKMDSFVPAKLTRRMIVSKRAALYDPLGKLEPVKAMLKIHEREAVLATTGWDDFVSSSLRSKWVKNFLLIEQLKGLKFNRARMPGNAVDKTMRIITLVDGAKDLIMVSCWCGFRLKEGGWSNQHLIGRSTLGLWTIPRNELQALLGGSNLSWIVRKSLPDWIGSHIIAGDSSIALHWTISDTRKLGEWHRNRVIQIRRGTDMDKLYYVGTDDNVADIGTRAEKISITDVGPNSRYETGDPWMKLDIEVAVESGFLKPAENLKAVTSEEEEDFKKGFVFDKEPEVLTRGHYSSEKTYGSGRIAKIEERATYSNYGKLLPTRRSFPAMVRVAASVIAFITKCRQRVAHRKKLYMPWKGPLLKESSLWFSAFPVSIADSELGNTWVNIKPPESTNHSCDKELVDAFSQGLSPVSLAYYMETHTTRESSSGPAHPSAKYLNAALRLYFRLSSNEVIHFNSKTAVTKCGVLHDGILLSNSRLLQGMNFIETAELDTLNLGNIGLKTKIPVIDRFSPLAYSIALHIHWKIAKHKGMESCLRISLEHVHILQGMSLFREIALECIRCKIKRGRFIQASLGPLSDKQLIVAPPFYAIQVDLCGPCRVFVPGYERETRATKVKQSKVWIMVAVCLVTSNTNLQVCEMKDTGSMIEAITRLACECGYPKYIGCDKESSILAALREIDVSLRDLQHRLYREHGVLVEECAVGGHDQHGKVERTIRTIQDSLEDLGLSKMRIHSLGLQTLCKQVENAYNNLPLGYRYDREQDNTEALKILVPNMLRIGRVNSRAIDGPVRLSNSNRKMLSDIQTKYETWFKLWREVYVPKLMAKKHGFRNDRDLKPSDLVYFRKSEGELSGSWLIGRVEQVVRGRDGVIRRVIVAYRNANETVSRYTERSVRSLIRLYSADDPDLQVDLSVVQKRIDELQGLLEDRVEDLVEVVGSNVCQVRSSQSLRKCGCCCLAHCGVTFHNFTGSKKYNVPAFGCEVLPLGYGLDIGLEELREENYSTLEGESLEYMVSDEADNDAASNEDTLSSIIMSLDLNLE